MNAWVGGTTNDVCLFLSLSPPFPLPLSKKIKNKKNKIKTEKKLESIWGFQLKYRPAQKTVTYVLMGLKPVSTGSRMKLL